MANPAGFYSLSELAAGTYTITPSAPGYQFTPENRIVTVPNDAVEQNFMAVKMRSWTWMFYLAEDQAAGPTDLQGEMPTQFSRLKQASANADIHIVALADSRDTNTRYLTFSPNAVNVIDTGELSTGDPSTLTNYIQWAQETYPADHYALIIVDHGHGLTGFATDDDAPGDSIDCNHSSCLTLKELHSALFSVKKLDIVNMIACTMGTIEVATQLRGLADFYVSSEELIWVTMHPDWWANGNNSSVPALTADTTPEQLAVSMAQSYFLEKSQPGNDFGPGTISVARLANVDDVIAKTSALAAILKSQMDSTAADLSTVGASVQRFDSDGNLENNQADELIDLFDFADKVQNQFSNDSSITTAAAQLKSSVQRYIATSPSYQLNWSGQFTYFDGEYNFQLANSHGVSVFLPHQSSSFYTDNWLEFAKGTYWDIHPGTGYRALGYGSVIEWGPMVVEYIRRVNPGEADDPMPPALIEPLIPQTERHIYLPVIIR